MTLNKNRESYSLLVVDDEERARRHILEDINWATLNVGPLYEASDGRIAMEMLRRHHPDLMILDIRMPHLDGVGLLDLITQPSGQDSGVGNRAGWMRGSLPMVIALSGYSDFEAARRMLSSGIVVEYLLKPASEDQLFEAVYKGIERIDIRRGVQDITEDESEEGLEKDGSDDVRWNHDRLGENGSNNVRWNHDGLVKDGSNDIRWNHDELVKDGSNDIRWNHDELGENGSEREKGIGTSGSSSTYIRVQGLHSFHTNENIVTDGDRNRSMTQSGKTGRHNGMSSQAQIAIIQDVKQYIRKNYSKKLTLNTAADLVHINSSYLSRLFMEVEGIGFSDYLCRVRIEEAKLLLQDYHLKIYEVSDAVGYQDVKHFLKVFKKQTGMTPSEYREHSLMMF